MSQILAIHNKKFGIVVGEMEYKLELHKYSTHFAIKIWRSGLETPERVHVGQEKYIRKIWQQLCQSKY